MTDVIPLQQPKWSTEKVTRELVRLIWDERLPFLDETEAALDQALCCMASDSGWTYDELRYRTGEVLTQVARALRFQRQHREAEAAVPPSSR
jgi:hypothetical protein